MDLETRIRQDVYRTAAETGRPPTIAELATATSVPGDEVREALTRLAAGRIVVLQPSGEILMAPPYSAIPTPFLVEIGGRRLYANCAWDALGVPAMLRAPARVAAGCGCCGDAIDLTAPPDATPASDAVVHFAVPAARWWHDMVFT